MSHLQIYIGQHIEYWSFALFSSNTAHRKQIENLLFDMNGII